MGTFSMLYFSKAWEAQSTASCCISSDMSAFLMTAFLSAMTICFWFYSCNRIYEKREFFLCRRFQFFVGGHQLLRNPGSGIITHRNTVTYAGVFICFYFALLLIVPKFLPRQSFHTTSAGAYGDPLFLKKQAACARAGGGATGQQIVF